MERISQFLSLRLNRHSIGVFLTLSALYLSVSLLRWLSWILFFVPFQTHDPFRWTPPHAIDELQLMLMVITPACVLAALLYLITRRHATQLRALLLLALVLFVVTLLIDLDMSWFMVSHRHIGATEVRVFLFENWHQYINVPGSYVSRMLRRTVIHLIAYTAFVALAVWVPNLTRILPRKVRAYALMFIALMTCADVVWANYDIAIGDHQVEALSVAHPMRANLIDGIFARLRTDTGALGLVNHALSTAKPNTGEASANPLAAVMPAGSAAGANVIILAVEGFNADYLGHLTALNDIKKTAIIGNNHYSTGDATQLGLLGISHGSPVWFYGDDRRPQSPYIAHFNAGGYRTREFGVQMNDFAELGEYSRNFSLPAAVPADSSDWTMLAELSSYAAAGGKYVAIVYYFGTHWPYLHDGKYAGYQPEVPADFDYSRWDLQNYRQAITNRYENSLDELNDWLRQLLKVVDLRHTVLVIVGDHGEELLAEGRLSHSGGVWEGQIRTPLLIHTPAYASSRLTSVTSHANILPAVSAAVGVPVPVEGGEHVLAPKGFAVAGHTNHTSKPSEWVLVRDPYKVLFGMDRHGRFVVTGVTDRRDHDVLSTQLMVDPAFLQTLAVMKGVEQLSLSRGAGPPQ